MNPLAERPPADLRLSVRGGDAGARGRRSRSLLQLRRDLSSLSSELDRDLARWPVDAFAVPSLCEGWSVRDVLEHLVSGDALAVASLSGSGDSDGRPAPLTIAPVDLDVSALSSDELVARFVAGRQALLAAAAGLDARAAGERVPWVAGGITAFALLQARVMETWIHGWDMRWPLDVPQAFDDRCWWLADIAVRHVPYAFRLAGEPVPDLDLSVRLAGTAGGQWSRQVGTAPGTAVEIHGPAWAWVTWAARRGPGAASRPHLVHDGSHLAERVVSTARSFA